MALNVQSTKLRSVRNAAPYSGLTITRSFWDMTSQIESMWASVKDFVYIIRSSLRNFGAIRKRKNRTGFMKSVPVHSKVQPIVRATS